MALCAYGYLFLALFACTQCPLLLFQVSPLALSSVAPAPGAFLGRESFSGPHLEHPAHQGQCTCLLGSVAACWQMEDG